MDLIGMQGLFRSSIVTVGLKIVVQRLFLHRLAWLLYYIRQLGQISNKLSMNRHISNFLFVLRLVSELVSPIFLSVLLDENCGRFYLWFDQSLEDVMIYWYLHTSRFDL